MEGALTWYGQAEPWKIVKQKYGTTKPTQSENHANRKHKKNDGCPPDTSKELLMPNKMKTQLTLKESLLQMDPRSKATKAKKRLPAIKLSTSKTILEKKVPVISLTAMLDPPVSPLVLDLPNYKWLQNSCWLDTSLQLLYVAMHHSHNEFSHIHDGLPENSAIKVVLATLLEWYELEEKSRITPAIL